MFSCSFTCYFLFLFYLACMTKFLKYHIYCLFQSNECESPGNGDLRYGHAFDSRCSKHSPVMSPNASSPALSELVRIPDCGCQVFNVHFCFSLNYNGMKRNGKHLHCNNNGCFKFLFDGNLDFFFSLRVIRIFLGDKKPCLVFCYPLTSKSDRCVIFSLW